MGPAPDAFAAIDPDRIDSQVAAQVLSDAQALMAAQLASVDTLDGKLTTLFGQNATLATAALARAAIDWRLACASDSLSGLTAAARAGLGVTVLAKGLIPPGLADLGPEMALPVLGAVEFILLRDPRLTRTGAADLAVSIVARARS